jgi:hypothetical protein
LGFEVDEGRTTTLGRARYPTGYANVWVFAVTAVVKQTYTRVFKPTILKGLTPETTKRGV